MPVNKKSLYLHIAGLLAATTLLVGASPVWSNGFFLPEQNVTNLGTAYAGNAALANDVTTNYTNAAGLTRLCGDQVVFGGVVVKPHTTLIVDRVTTSFGNALTPRDTRPKNFTAIPSMHYGSQINDQLAWGVSLVSTFGSKTNYFNRSIARYTATRSELITVDFAPSLAYRVNDCLSLGAGFDIVYVMARLDSKIGYGDPFTDGYFKNKGSKTTYGAHVAALYEVNDCTRFGFSYRSHLTARLKGHSLTKFSTLVPDPTTDVLVPAPTQEVLWHRARANLNLPDTALFGVYHDLNECLALVADVQWFHWKRYKNLTIRYDDGSTLFSAQDWRNTYRFALGGIYQYTPEWQLKLGGSFDKTSTRDRTRNIYIPDHNQTAVAIGARYQWSPCLAIDMGYVHVFYKKARIAQTAPIGSGPIVARGQPQQSIYGRVKNRIDAIGLQFTWDIQ